MNGTEIHLHARIFRTGTTWYADVDNDLDPQPDNPYWYGLYHSQRTAIEAVCARLAAFNLEQAERLNHQPLIA